MAEVAELNLMVDRGSPVPLYFQASRQIEDAIHTGVLPPGTRLENEVKLADRCGLSRPTIRRAIQELVNKGLLIRQRGVGTQVVDNPQVKRQVRLTSLFDDLAESGQEPTTQILLHDRVEADDGVAEQLGLGVGTELVYIERLRLAGGEPLAIMHNWLPVSLAGHLTSEELQVRGLYELLRASGVSMRLASQRMGARLATVDEADTLGLHPGAPLLTMERTTYDDAGRIVELGRHLYRADSYCFEVVLVDR